jgi:hypothetical protein
MAIWTILTIVALILLVLYAIKKGRNAVWGGLTLGIIVGVLWKLIGRTNWHVVIKVADVGILLGFGAELLGMLSDRLKSRT